EGKNLPVPHCIKGTDGWQLDKAVAAALDEKGYTPVEKITFGSVDLPERIKAVAGEEDFTIELVGLCTDICVVSNALLLKAHFPEVPIAVDAAGCAGVTPQAHEAALATMVSCQIQVK
ncbi:MAG: isochorismatase family protein, partial [Ruminococcus sp.]|nr:isochorismatase family protein [Ruminococcus sp.]